MAAAAPPGFFASPESHRRPQIVSAHVNPLVSARTFPSGGFGAVSTGASWPTKNSAIPTPSAARNHVSARRIGSRNRNGPISRT